MAKKRKGKGLRLSDLCGGRKAVAAMTLSELFRGCGRRRVMFVDPRGPSPRFGGKPVGRGGLP